MKLKQPLNYFQNIMGNGLLLVQTPIWLIKELNIHQIELGINFVIKKIVYRQDCIYIISLWILLYSFSTILKYIPCSAKAYQICTVGVINIWLKNSGWNTTKNEFGSC